VNRVVAASLVAVLLPFIVSCSAHGGPGGSGVASTVNVTTTEVLTRPAPTPTAPPSYRPPPAATVAALHSASAPMPPGEKEQSCPYIANQDAADLEGDRVYRSAIITTTKPVGCRFYFWASPFEAIGDIVPTTFATAMQAYNAMVATGHAGLDVEGVKSLIPGVDAVLYKTSFFGDDGANADWACAFANGRVMVVVHTQQTNVSYDAREFAAAVAAKF
jgi:hypothetical protein